MAVAGRAEAMVSVATMRPSAEASSQLVPAGRVAVATSTGTGSTVSSARASAVPT